MLSTRANAKTPKIKSGRWFTAFQLDDHDFLPVLFDFNQGRKSTSLSIINGSEQILLKDISFKGDSIIIPFPAFASEFRAKIHNKEYITGNWYNYAKKGNYFLPFWSRFESGSRFPEKEANFIVDGRWEVTFDYKVAPEKAVGLFNDASSGLSENKEGNTVHGTFLTETGDYRFLEGAVIGDSLYLSTFDGSHAFYFKACYRSDTLWGEFLSGKHYKTEWFAIRNEHFELTHPDSLTFVTNNSPLRFTLPNVSGSDYSYPNESISGKVTLIQIMGTWCPNCLDESLYLKKLIQRYPNELEIIAITFETQKELSDKIDKVVAYRTNLDLPYTFLIGGDACKSCATDLFPMLSNIISFPTLIFIDKTGNIRKIHTGFNGPGTGSYYDQFVESTNGFVDQLINE